MLPALRATGQDVRRIYSSDIERARSFARRQGVDVPTADLRHALDDGIDAVYVSSRNDRHAPDVIAAADAGRHVLCEKPLATTAEEAVAMVAACDARGVVLATNHHLRGSAALRELARQVGSGAIGEVLSARVQNAIMLSERLRTWRVSRRDSGGGVIFDLAVHDIDLLRFALGRDLVEVTALSASQRFGSAGVEDVVVSAQRYANDVLAVTHESYTVPWTETLIEVHGTDGSITAVDALRPDSRGRLSISESSGQRTIEIAPSDGMYEHVVRDFCAAVASGGRPAASGGDGVMSLLGALALRESAATRSSVPVQSPSALRTSPQPRTP
jgi:1,5-anhydro-D-fructose reductase (1,5-anhydro-D-mannitol-forming)